MKEMNRREFLTLTGAAVVALSLAGCGGPSAPPEPPAPPASESKELALFKAINEVWYEVNKQVAPNPNLDICKSVVYCQEAADLAKFTASPFETYEPEVDEEDFRKWNLPDDVFHEYQRHESEMIEGIRKKYGNGSYRGTAGCTDYLHAVFAGALGNGAADAAACAGDDSNFISDTVEIHHFHKASSIFYFSYSRTRFATLSCLSISMVL